MRGFWEGVYWGLSVVWLCRDGFYIEDFKSKFSSREAWEHVPGKSFFKAHRYTLE